MLFSDYQNSVKSSPRVLEMANFRDSRFQNFFPRGLALSVLGSRAFGTWDGGPHKLWPRGPLSQSYTPVKYNTCTYSMSQTKSINEPGRYQRERQRCYRKDDCQPVDV